MAEPATAAQPTGTTAAPAPQPAPIPDATYQRLEPAEQAKFANVRKSGVDGGSEWVARESLAADPATTTAAPDLPAPNADGKYKFGETEFSEQEMRDFLTARGEAELRKASLPQSPADYKAELPASLELPVKFEIDESDPLLADARAWAHSKGFDQATFSEMVGIYATSKANEAAQLNAAHAAEVAKMGQNGAQRVTALETWLRGTIGGEEAKQMKAMLVTAGIVRGMEKLQQKFSSQGVAPFSQQHREPRDSGAGRVSQEQYDNMTSAQRLDYSRGFDQSQFTQGAR